MAEQDTPEPVETPSEPQPDVQTDSSADYANYQKPEKERNPIWRKLGIGLAALAVLVVLAAAAYWFISNRKTDDKSASTTETTQNESQLAQTDSQITTKTKHYVSQNFRLEFDYPEDWTASQDNAEAITALSPDLKLKDTTGKEVVGQIYFRIRAATQNLEGLDEGDATAARASNKISYTKPTQVQRDSTYISFLRYVSSAQANTLDAVYITGDIGYQKDQVVPKLDIEKVDPTISIEFYLCPNSGCEEISGVSGVGISTWDDKNISGPLENMLKSLIIN